MNKLSAKKRNEQRRKRAADLRTDRFLRVCARYLRYAGWYVAIGGPVTVEKRDFTAKFKYSLVVDFVGRPR